MNHKLQCPKRYAEVSYQAVPYSIYIALFVNGRVLQMDLSSLLAF